MRISFLSQGFLLVGGWVIACGGSVFSTAPGDAGGVDTGSGETGSPEAGGGPGGPDGNPDSTDAMGGIFLEGSVFETGPTGPSIPCGPQISCAGATQVCCLPAAGPSCAHDQCGCATELHCASDADCTLPNGACCIQNRPDAACASGHFVARCAAACLNGSSRICNPSAPRCPAQQCSTDGGDLQNVGLPMGDTYGVCK
jgi:hypothetical protein